MPGSIIIPPVFIGSATRIERSIIGPYVSIAEGCFISNSILRDSIINENARVSDVLLDGSLIGANATVSGRPYNLNVGDSSEVNLS